MLLQRESSTTNECQGCFNSFQFQFQKINKIKTLIFFLLPIANVKRQNRIFLQTRLLFFVGWFEKAKADIICQFKIDRFDKRQLPTIVKSKLYQTWVKIIHEPGQKSWGEGRGFMKIFRGGSGGVKNFLKILLQICDNPERSQNFSEKMAFFSQKSQKFLQICHLFLKFCFAKF